MTAAAAAADDDVPVVVAAAAEAANMARTIAAAGLPFDDVLEQTIVV